MQANALKNILYAEDDPDIRAIAKIALEEIGGFTVQYCCSGHEALNAAATFTPDLILLDVMMPGMDGPTTLSELRKIPVFKEIPAVFMTAKIQPEEIAAYQSLGVIEVIAKPFDPMILADSLRSVWEKQ